MLGRKALFPGRDYLHQLRLIIDVLGTPSEEDLASIANAQAVQFLRTLPPKPKKPWSEVFPNAAPAALELLGRMLVFDPAKRCAAADALAHPYVADWREPDVEKPAGFYIDMDDIEALRLTKRNLQKMFFDEVLSIHRPQLAPPGLGLDASPAFSSRSMASTNSSPEFSSRSL